MAYFPMFVNLKGQKCVVVGGGEVASRKVEKLLYFEPRIMVVAPSIVSELEEMERSEITIIGREFEPEDLEGAALVIAATDDRELNGRISALCREKKIPVNAVDEPENCTFFFPALVERGNVTIGISTAGKSPLLAKKIREKLESVLGEELAGYAEELGRERERVKREISKQEKRAEIFEGMLQSILEEGGGSL